jgi:hypothetical protein
LIVLTLIILHLNHGQIFTFIFIGCNSNLIHFKKNFAPAKVTTPPGTVQLKDSLYIDRIEVTNEMWRAFTEGWLLK